MAGEQKDIQDYSDFTETPKPTNEAFAALNELVEEAKKTQKQILRLSADLEREQTRLNGIIHTRLPMMMKQLGLKKFTTTDGLEINVAEQVEAHISEDRRGAAIKWLDDNGHGGIIKRQISVDFNRDQQDEANALLAELEGRFASLAEKKTVHPQTLKAFVREQLKKGASIPIDLFGIRKLEVAKIPDLKQ